MTMTQNLFHAAVVTQGWNGYRNKNQHRKLTQQKKIRPSLLPRLESKTFRSGIWRSTNELSLHPDFKYVCTNLILFVTCDEKLVNLLSADLVTNPWQELFHGHLGHLFELIGCRIILFSVDLCLFLGGAISISVSVKDFLLFARDHYT